MQHPELLQAYKSQRKRLEIGQLIALVIIAGILICMAAFIARAETCLDLQERYRSVEVGIAPGEHESNVEIVETAENPYQTISISDSEFEELRWVLALEAQGEGFEGEIAVCEVIFNRVLSGRWGEGIHGVLSKKGQFSTYKMIGSSRAWCKPGQVEDDAISECMRRGPSTLPDMKYVYFDTGRKNGSRNIKIGHHWFGSEK